MNLNHDHYGFETIREVLDSRIQRLQTLGASSITNARLAAQLELTTDIPYQAATVNSPARQETIYNMELLITFFLKILKLAALEEPI